VVSHNNNIKMYFNCSDIFSSTINTYQGISCMENRKHHTRNMGVLQTGVYQDSHSLIQNSHYGNTSITIGITFKKKTKRLTYTKICPSIHKLTLKQSVSSQCGSNGFSTANFGKAHCN